MTHGQNGDQGGDTDEVQNRSLVEDQVIVETGESEHQGKADDQPADLLHVHAGEGAAVGGRINLDDAERANGGEDGEEPPIVVASSGCVFHLSIAGETLAGA